jgi:hypothetical protein
MPPHREDGRGRGTGEVALRRPRRLSAPLADFADLSVRQQEEPRGPTTDRPEMGVTYGRAGRRVNALGHDNGGEISDAGGA